MLKNILLLLTIVSLPGCFGHQPKVNTGLEGNPMPSFNLLLIDSATRLNTQNIPTGEPIILFYFSPECPYCKAQTETIVNNMQSMQNIRFYFFSSYPVSFVRQYAEQYQLNKFTNITVGQDYENYFGNYFKVEGIPYIVIYNKDKIMKQALIGSVGANIIKDISLR